VEQALERYVERDDAVALLRTIPGVGLVTSSTIRAWTADIDRFNRYKEYASYCGLVPYLKESNDVTYLGQITKRGPKELRTAMVQVVMGMLRVREKTLTGPFTKGMAIGKQEGFRQGDRRLC